MRDWSSDVCSSDLHPRALQIIFAVAARGQQIMSVQQGVGGAKLGQDVVIGHKGIGSFVQKAVAVGGRFARVKIGRASRRERGGQYVSSPVVAVSLNMTITTLHIPSTHKNIN